MFLNLFKSSAKKVSTQPLSENSVSNELNSLLNDLTIDSTCKEIHEKEESSTNEVSSLEKQIEENQILYAKIMQERMMRTRRKLT
ncbi:hypothetical protein [Maribacter sp.]|uniref:hypothetical protein n=1 Tax=Maribacter sp. TaxID=1897614 RepID=UPI003298E296